MKLSIENYTVAERFGDIPAIEMIKDAGFDAIDYSYYYNKEREEVLGENYKQYAQNIRAHLDRVGIVCNQAHAPFSIKYDTDTSLVEKKHLWLTRAIESASILGAKNIVVHSITVPDGVDFEAYNIEYYKRLIPYCEAYGICVAVENLFRRDTKQNRFLTKLGSPEELNSFVKKINSPWIVACVDVGHASLTGFEPQDFISGMDSQILKCLHIQDNDYLDDRHILPFTGNLNWHAIVTALKNKGYNGDLTLEVPAFTQRFPSELIPDALKFAAAIGRHLISLCESK